MALFLLFSVPLCVDVPRVNHQESVRKGPRLSQGDNADEPAGGWLEAAFQTGLGVDRVAAMKSYAFRRQGPTPSYRAGWSNHGRPKPMASARGLHCRHHRRCSSGRRHWSCANWRDLTLRRGYLQLACYFLLSSTLGSTQCLMRYGLRPVLLSVDRLKMIANPALQS